MAVTPQTGRVAAPSKDTPGGLWASRSSATSAYSAKAPRPKPNTSSPTETFVTAGPAATTTPAKPVPSTGFFGRRAPKIRRPRYGRPVIACHAPRSRPAATTRTTTSWSPGSGRGTSSRRSTSVSPYLSRRIARIVPLVGSGPFVPPTADDELVSARMADLRDPCRVDRSQPPTGDQEPQREQQLTQERECGDAGELEAEDGGSAVEGVAGPGDHEQHADDLGDEVGPQGQVAQERQVDPEQEQPEVVEVLEGVQLEQGVLADVSGARRGGGADGQDVEGSQQLTDGHEQHRRVHQPEHGGQHRDRRAHRPEHAVQRPGDDGVQDHDEQPSQHPQPEGAFPGDDLSGRRRRVAACDHPFEDDEVGERPQRDHHQQRDTGDDAGSANGPAGLAGRIGL